MHIVSYRSLIAILGFSCLLSCKKLIEIPPGPPDQLPTEMIFADSSNALAAVAGVYTAFQIVDNYSAIYHNGGITITTALAADELNVTNDTNTEHMAFSQNEVLSNSSTLSVFWKMAYKMLYQVNVCLEGIAGSKGISEPLREQLTGELKVVRAFNYFNLVNLFGGVPIVTGIDYKVNARLPRSTEQEVYALIVADLTDARALLKPEYPSEGRARPNRHTATAFLAKVSLYQGRWEDAATYATEVIGAGIYDLEDELADIFLEGSTEAIWQLPARGNYSQTAEALVFSPSYEGALPNYTLKSSLLDAFTADDGREAAWTKSEVINGQVYTYPHKYKNRMISETPVESYMMLRLADLYLIRAEAYIHESMEDEALKDLNEVHTRAGLLPVVGTAGLEERILHERRLELFCEWGNRWFDLKRTGSATAVLGPQKTGWQATDVLLPVPFDEILSNPFLIQNEGYK